LRVLFPLNIKSDQASYEIQFGHLHRPTHFNTSHDSAKFEVCGHKWSNISEYNNGVALLNDCKYGYSTHDNIMGLSLLRSPKSPDDTCDMGMHQFKYALFHHNDNIESVIKEAYHFNSSLELILGSSPLEQDLIELNSNSIILESLKKSEKGDFIILRLYESLGGHKKQMIQFGKSIKKVYQCNYLERKDVELEMKGQKVFVDFTPFKIVTLKLEK
jgi:alpha-mannosidase